MSRLRWLMAFAFAIAVLPAGASAQERGTIVGQVIDQATQQPLQGAQVVIAGTTTGTLTNQQGRFVIASARPGAVEVRVSLIGYAAASQPVQVQVGQTATVNFALTQTAVAIEGVIVTATGEQIRRREIGNAVSGIRAEELNLAATNNLSQVLTARAPGVVVQGAAGSTGTSSRIRIRGANSVSLSNEPLLIIDGVRVNNSVTSNSINVGGQTTSRWNDINPEDIENIEIIKGPAGVALYGTAAANGVIQVTTKRGRVGATRWNAFVESGMLRDVNQYPSNFAQIGRLTATGARTLNCNIDAQAQGLCTPSADSLASYNPLMQDSPFRDGWRRKYGLSVSGGSDMATYYLSGDVEDEQGVVDPNNLGRYNLRANVRSQLRSNLDVTATTGYLSSRLRLPFGDNTGYGVVAAGVRGRAFACTPATPCISGTAVDSLSRGYSSRHPSEFYFVSTNQDVERFNGGITANWQPLPWLRGTGQAGMDMNNRYDHQLALPGISSFNTSLAEGWRTSNRYQISSYNANAAMTATYGLPRDIQATSTVGTQYAFEGLHGTTAYGRNLLPGIGSLPGASAGYAVGEINQDVVTVGAYAQQQLAWRDRLFVTGAVRGDDNSAFGAEFDIAVYPSISASWVVTEEPFFPQLGWLNTLRLRSAYGQSGQRPGFRQAETFFSPVSARIGELEVPAITVGGTGNALLRPERSTEVEFGFDAGLLNDRVAVEITYYDKTTTDALVQRRLAPSLGATTNRFDNIGEMRNRGIEALVRGTLVDTRAVQWDGTLSMSTNENMLVNLGQDIAPILFGFDGTQRFQSGFPAGAYFARRIVSFEDRNNDGIISRVNCPTYGGVRNPQVEGGPACELVLSDTAEFLGTPLPGRQASLSSGVTLFGWMRVAGQLDYQGDLKLYNSSEEFRCSTSVGNCRGYQDRTASLEEQARAVARQMGSYDGFIQDADFVKLRELSLTLSAPQPLAGRMGASGVSLTLAGRNLGTWSRYLGVDPEVNSNANAANGFTVADYDAQPPVRYWTARVNVNF